MKRFSSRPPLPAPRSPKHAFLLEIGTEEMPAHYLAYIVNREQNLIRSKFEDTIAGLNPKDILIAGDLKVYLTPRRIVLGTEALVFDPKPLKEAVVGPAWDKAYDSAGKPAPALLGFMRSNHLKPGQIVEMEKKGRRAVGFWRLEKPKSLENLLTGVVQEFFQSLKFPKTMRWDNSGVHFPRPVRHILCMLDRKLLKVQIGNLRSGTLTRDFVNGRHSAIRVKSTRDYFRVMKKRGIILDPALRKNRIESEVKRLTQKAGGVYQPDEELLDEVNYLVERPVCVSGPFDRSFQNLPREVLIASLAKGQRLFSVTKASGEHLPNFIAVLDGDVLGKPRVIETIASILKAKLQDSQFFYDQDLGSYREPQAIEKELETLGYLKGIGSVADKIKRMKKIAPELKDACGLSDEESQFLGKAIQFSKTDLLSHMVGEFPQLQGVMGRIAYEKLFPPEKDIALAIGEQYLPVGLGSALPRSKVGAALAVLDKADLIVACFLMGKEPSASQDPYALKRAMNGIIAISCDQKFALNIESLMESILKESEKFKKASQDIRTHLRNFVRDRIFNFFEAKGFHPEWIQAVLAVETDKPLIVYERLMAIQEFYKTPEYEKAHKVVERTSNILKPFRGKALGNIQPEVFLEDSERSLFSQLNSQQEGICKAFQDGNYQLATRLYADSFFDILHAFFDQVMVNVEDEKVRTNRLALLNQVRKLYVNQMADLSKIRPKD